MYKVKATVTIKLLLPKKPNLLQLTEQIESVIDGKKAWKIGRYEDAYVSNIKVKKAND
jgi:hypothetical protein